MSLFFLNLSFFPKISLQGGLHVKLIFGIHRQIQQSPAFRSIFEIFHLIILYPPSLPRLIPLYHPNPSLLLSIIRLLSYLPSLRSILQKSIPRQIQILNLRLYLLGLTSSCKINKGPFYPGLLLMKTPSHQISINLHYPFLLSLHPHLIWKIYILIRVNQN